MAANEDEVRLKLLAETFGYRKAWADVRVQTAKDLAQIKSTVANSLNQAKQSAAQNFAAIKQNAASQLGQTRLEVARQLAQIKTQTARDLAEIRQNTRKTLSGIGSDISGFGSQVKSAGAALTVGLTAPLAALAAVSTRSALQLDTFRNRLLAVEGSAEAAERRITNLRSLAQGSVGVTTRLALDAFSQFKVIGDITEETIERQIKAFGRLNAAFTIDDPSLFNRNLVQIFSQNFEIKDIREALGRVPIFNQLLESAFGSSDPERLRQLKAAGALTLDSFLAGLAGAVESSPTLSKIQESLSVRLEKTFERIQFALAPIGETILRTIEPYIEPAARFIERLGAAFESLPGSARLALVLLGGIAAVVGPAVVALGALVAAVGAVVTAVGAVGAPLVAGIAAAVAVAVAASAALVVAWQANFGGIREITTRVMTEVSSFVQGITGTLIQWWQQNLPLIRETVQTVLNAVRELWAAHGAEITAVVTATWGNIKTVVGVALNTALGIVRFTMQVINEDWRGAWQTFQATLGTTLRGVASLLGNLPTIVLGVLRTVVGVVIRAGAEIHDRALAVGFEIGRAIVLSILRGIASVNPQAAIALALVTAISGAGAEATKAAAAHGAQAGQAFASSFSQWGAADGPWGEQPAAAAQPRPTGTAGGGGAAGGGAAKEDPRKRVIEELRQEVARLTVETDTYNKTADEQEIAQLRLRLGIDGLTGKYRELAEALLNIIRAKKEHLASLADMREAEDKLAKDWEEMEGRRESAARKVTAEIDRQIVGLVGQETQLERVNRVILEADILGAIDARTAAWLRQLAVLNDIAEQVNNTAPPALETVPIPHSPGQENGPVVDPSGLGPPPPGQWATFGQVVADVSRTIGEAVGVTGEVVNNVFNTMAAAVHQTVQAFGGLAGVAQNLGAFFKAVVRNIAQTAAIQSLYEAAQALAAWALSFIWPSMAASAVLHGKAAALYGVVAGVAGAASAAIGGGGSPGAAGALADGGAGGRGGGSGGAGDSERDRTISEGRRGGASDPSQARLLGVVAVDIKQPDGQVERKLVDIWEGMGPFRDRVMRSTVGTAESMV